MKIRNQQWPRLPRSAILKAQECPCFRNGCLCNFSELHLYRHDLLVPPGKSEVLRSLEETKKVWQAIKEESEQTLGKLKENITKLQMVSTEEEEQVKQIDVQVKVGNETIAAIVDCGADVDYVNEEWCKRKGFPITETGEGLMRGFDGRQTRAKIQKTEIKFRFEGVFMRQKFRVVKETDNDLMVLGLPWLQRINPDIDWKKRTVTLREKASKDLRRKNETPALPTKNAKKASTKTSQEKEAVPTGRKRGGYGGDETPPKKNRSSKKKDTNKN